jgi:hypothetical protein
VNIQTIMMTVELEVEVGLLIRDIAKEELMKLVD